METTVKLSGSLILLVALAGVLQGSGLAASATGGPDRTVLAVVINDAHPEADLSLAELRRIYLGEQRFWSDGTPIHGVLPPQQPAGLSEAFIRGFLGLSPNEFWRRWKSNAFRGLNNRTPRSLSTAPSTLRVIFRSKVPIAVVPFESLPENAAGLRILSVDGRRPGEPGYPLVTGEES